MASGPHVPVALRNAWSPLSTADEQGLWPRPMWRTLGRLISRPPQTASVVISCFNYERFIGNAIASALEQTRPPKEVIVVDDGSADRSREVIGAHKDRVRMVFKEHGGMASALNAGCRLATGDVIFLLDADDVLFPDAIETVLGQWEDGTVMTQSRLAMGNAEGRQVRGTTPPPDVPLDHGDVRPVLLTNGAFSVTLTSGLAIRRPELLAVLPIPEQLFVGAAEGYLVRAVAFLGPIQAVDRPLALYRRHDTNDTALGSSPVEMGKALRKRIGFMRTEFEIVKGLAVRHGLQAMPDVGERNPEYLFLRLCSLVMDPANHSVPGDTRARLLPRVVGSVLGAPTPLRPRQMAGLVLAAAVVVLPRPLGRRLVAWWFMPEARPRWLTHMIRLVARWRSGAAPLAASLAN